MAIRLAPQPSRFQIVPLLSGWNARFMIEPSAGVSVAVAIGRGHAKLPREVRRVGVILCGGNVDLDALPWLSKP
jgi:threonine dehydratase